MITQVYLSLGSNISNRLFFLQTAVDYLRRLYPIVKLSSIYETEPQDYLDQPCFYNQVLALEVDHLHPHRLLKQTQIIEKKMGKWITIPKGPRTIDLDILLFKDYCLNTASLTLPHPGLIHRKFALIPLQEITREDFIIPGQSQTLKERIQSLDGQSVRKIF